MRTLAALALLLAACGGAPLAEVDPGLASIAPTWSEHIAALMRARCAECHSADGLRAGGVEVDTYEALWSARVKNACVSLDPALIDRFAAALHPIGPGGHPEAEPCHGFEPATMPTGALPPLSQAEQVIFGRWVELGGPR